jgi:hypothetical protein
MNEREEFKSFQCRFMCPTLLIHKFLSRLTLVYECFMMNCRSKTYHIYIDILFFNSMFLEYVQGISKRCVELELKLSMG